MVFFWRKNRQQVKEPPNVLAPTIHSSSSSSSSASAFSSIDLQNALPWIRPYSAKCSLVDPRETDNLCSASPLDSHNALRLPIHSSSELSSVDPAEIERPPCPPSSYSYPFDPQNALPPLKPPFAHCPLVGLQEAEPPFCGSSSSSSSSSSSPRSSSFNESDLPKNVFSHGEADEPITNQASPCEATEETLLTVPGAIIHLIDERESVELAGGDLSIVRLIQSENMIAVFARIADVQWPLAKDEAAVKLDDSHYFFSLRVPAESGSQGSDAADWVLNYGLTFEVERQEKTELDGILEQYSCFSVHSASKVPGSEPPAKEGAEAAAAAYWTTLAPNVNDYSGLMARAVAVGSGQLVRGIIWCGDVTVERLKWGNDFLKKRMDPNSKPAEIDKHTLKRIKRAKKVTKMSQKVMSGILCGVVKVGGFFTSSVTNSAVGQKFFRLLPGEVVLATIDGFGKVCDAVEVAGKNVLTTSSEVTTELVTYRYGEQAGVMTKDGLGAAGHAVGAAWSVLKIRNALNPKNTICVMTPSEFAKSTAKVAAVVLEERAKPAK
ncbi:hypothetical protein EJ110_NYTH01443 [Nymphaea thermarum]|nr:hypothetical protein EJ110_NYTH01443 [Nymphaea thermarum]